MMQVTSDGRDVRVVLRDDVWAMEEPGTLVLTRTQAQTLRLHLDSWAFQEPFHEQEPEDG